MKLRIKGNSMRLRISRSELERFAVGETVQETVHFGPGPDAKLTYALHLQGDAPRISVAYSQQKVTVQIPVALAQHWVNEECLSLSESIDLGEPGALDLLIERDYACLDHRDADNEDTFPHPKS